MNTPRPNWSFNTPNSRFRFCAPAAITTTSLAETLTIARFMLCDRDADAFSRPPDGGGVSGLCPRALLGREGRERGVGVREPVLLRAAQCRVWRSLPGARESESETAGAACGCMCPCGGGLRGSIGLGVGYGGHAS